MTLATVMSHAVSPDRIAAVRRFSRFYTRQIGLLHEGLLGSAYSLTEARVIYELGTRGTATASDLAAELDLDQGYLSRILRSFEARGLLHREPSETDGRQSLLSLTEVGRTVFAGFDARSAAEIAALLGRLGPAAQDRLVAALGRAEALLGGAPAAAPQLPYLLRPPRTGDIGWIVHRQAVLYAEEYGWDASYEALAAEIAAKFAQNFDARRERCWIAEREGEVAGSVFLVRRPPAEAEEVAQLRLLYVEPAARGLGIGRRLVEECIGFARGAGYRRIMLWTNDVLVAARRIYQAAGFRLTAEAPHHSFGHDLVGQTWERAL
jgi:DNA-binding MarR family transcriptional regulator/GNAT superfamily N-acetyltransferase